MSVPVEIYLEPLIGQTIRGEISGVRAKVVDYITATESERGNPTLYVKYQSGRNDEGEIGNQAIQFETGENLVVVNDVKYSLSTIRTESTFATTLLTDSIGEGSVAKIANGVYFIRGFFVDVSDQKVILDHYTIYTRIELVYSLMKRSLLHQMKTLICLIMLEDSRTLPHQVQID